MRRADGAEAGALFDLPGQGLVSLHIEDVDLARLLQERGIVPPRPPYLDAVHGGHVPRPQVNWFLEPPVGGVAAALDEALRATNAGYEIAPAARAPVAAPPAAGSAATARA
ncbi:MAG: hypothetical protein ABR527_10960 [Gemmatimonadota bacterium]